MSNAGSYYVGHPFPPEAAGAAVDYNYKENQQESTDPAAMGDADVPGGYFIGRPFPYHEYEERLAPNKYEENQQESTDAAAMGDFLKKIKKVAMGDFLKKKKKAGMVDAQATGDHYYFAGLPIKIDDETQQDVADAQNTGSAPPENHGPAQHGTSSAQNTGSAPAENHGPAQRGTLSAQIMDLNILECILAGSQEPSHLDLSLLQSITENFSEQRKIGVGGCGEVYKGILRNGIVAVKKLFNSRTIKDKMFHREVKSLITLRHENIVRLLGYCSFTEERVFIFEGRPIMADLRERLLCFEYISNGNLEDHLTDELRGLEWHTRYNIIVGICEGLLYLHMERDIVHMDLKPANILLDDNMVPKITDFGLSRFDNNSHTKTASRLVSLGYCAPEYLSKGKSSNKSDIYSLGVIITELVTGSKNEPDLTKVLRRWRHRWIKSLKHTPLGYQQVTKCLELAQRCIQMDPTSRPDIVYITHELNAMDSKDDQFQGIPWLDDILGIKPLEIHFPFELDPQISYSIELTNDTDGYIAFMTKATLCRFLIEPEKGIVPPRSKCSVTVTIQAQVDALPKNHYKEEITVLSTRVDGGLSAMDITRDVFIEKEGIVVDEVTVMVVFDDPQSSDVESSSDEESEKDA